MEARYRLIREVGVRNIDSYNQVIESGVLPQGATLTERDRKSVV